MNEVNNHQTVMKKTENVPEQEQLSARCPCFCWLSDFGFFQTFVFCRPSLGDTSVSSVAGSTTLLATDSPQLATCPVVLKKTKNQSSSFFSGLTMILQYTVSLAPLPVWATFHMLTQLTLTL